MGFIRQQEEKLAARWLRRQHEQAGGPVPPDAVLRREAARIVDDAHRIARERGGNLLEIMRGMVADWLKKK
jgi:hypothetical protein